MIPLKIPNLWLTSSLVPETITDRKESSTHVSITHVSITHVSITHVSITHVSITLEGVILPEEYSLCNRLKLARVERNLNQAELADLAGVTRQTISSIETGQYVPSTKLALILAKELGKDVNQLFYLAERS